MDNNVGTFLQGLKAFAVSFLLAGSLCCISCGKEPDPGQTPSGDDTEQPTPGDGSQDSDKLEIIDGKARFYLAEPDNSILSALGKQITDWTAYTLSVGSKEYEINVDTQGKAYADVDASSAGTYNAVLTSEASSSYFGASKYIGLHHPYALAYHTLKNTVSSFPLYASYSEETGNRLVFSMACSLLELTLTGDAKIASVKVENPSGDYMAGKGNYMASKQYHSITEGVPFVVVNYTNSGNFVKLTDAGTKIYIPIAAGSYTQGLDVRVCDSENRFCDFRIEAFEVTSDKTHKVTHAYKPDSDLIYFEGFDNFVWGGNIVGGGTTYGFAPSSEPMTVSGGKEYLGYEPALSSVSYDKAGAGFIQPETWSAVANKKVETASQLSPSYVRSRNIGSYSMLYRCQEYQGFVGVGTGNTYKGIFEPKVIPDVKNLTDLEISFDYCPKVGFRDNILLEVINGGKIISCTIDGEPAQIEETQTYYKGVTSSYVLRKDAVSVPTSTSAAKKWYHVSCEVEYVNDNTRFRLTTVDAGEGSHGFYLDNFMITRLKDRKKNALVGLRVLCWNIQNGMWYDQDKNYNNFVEWVKKYDPDVCIWCEGETIFNKQGVKVYGAERTLPNGWKQLAARYGHNYMSKSADVDNYPQIITSKHPITVLKQFSETDDASRPIVHGSGVFQISYLGQTMNFITFHAYAQKYAPQYEGKDQSLKDQSAANNEGDYHREHEVKYICDNIINGTEYSNCRNWLMMGDFNSKSRLDREHYSGVPATTWLLHDYILDNTDMIDVIHERNDDKDFFSSVNGDSQRIDYMYVSPDMYSRIENAVILIDSWTTLSQDTSVSTGYFCKSSDHRPILVDFKMK